MPRESIKSESLRGALDAFKTSRRYAVLKNLQLGRIVPEDCDLPSDVNQLSLEGLVAAGVEAIHNLRLSAYQEDSLIELLRSLSAEEELMNTTASADVEDRAEYERHVPGSVQVELDLRSRLTTITSDAKYETIRRQTLGDFWDRDWTPAPFEEALRIDQLARMDLAALFKKRSVNDQRLYCICQALDRAIQAVESPRVESSENLAISKDLYYELPKMWRTVDPDISLTDRASIRVIALGCESVSASPTRELARKLVDQLRPADVVALITGLLLSPAIIKKTRMIAQSSQASDSARLMEIVLRAPGVSTRDLVRLFRGRDEDPVFLELMAVVVARSLGASPVSWRGHVCPGYWTTNPSLLTSVAAGLFRAKTRSDQAHLLGDLDPFLLRWIRERQVLQKRGKKYQKRSIKRLSRRR